MSERLIGLVLLLFMPGCMAVPLRNNTTDEAQTVANVYQQQVLNNLAMFAYDADSFPYFSYANQGSSTVNDQGNVSITPTWSRVMSGGFPLLFGPLSANAAAQRQAAVGFTLTPVNDPRKLELMRCAYQKAIASCNARPAATACPDCESRFKVFYTGSPDGDIGTSAKGIVTSDCLGRSCWLGIGCKKDVPKGCPCQLVGEYCGVYVWVLPGGRNELSKLTLAILDYAINVPPTEAQKTVYYFIDQNGLPVPAAAAVGVVTANVAISEHNESLLNVPHDMEAKLRDQLQIQLQDIKSQIADAQRTNRTETLGRLFAQQQEIEGKLRFLDQQVQAGSLKQQYIGGPTVGAGTPAASGILPFSLQQNALRGVTP